MTDSPLISIGLAVYNGEKHIVRAIKSVINQTYTNWELIIVNDGSTDNTIGLIKTFNDNRITLIHNEQNLGVTPTRNKYLQKARGKYLAVIDADDEWDLKKLEIQIKFLEDHPDYGLCGCYANRIDNTTNSVWKYPVTDEKIRIRLIWGSAIIHSSILFRLDIIHKNHLHYNENFKQAEDYHLITQGIRYSKAYNIPETLLNYYIHPDQLTSSKKNEQQTLASQVGMNFIKTTLNIDVSNEITNDVFKKLFNFDFKNISNTEINKIGHFFDKISSFNHQLNIFNSNLLNHSLAERWFLLCYHSSGKTNGFKCFYKYKINKAYPISIFKTIRFYVKNKL